MAQDGDMSKAADKGKGKAIDVEQKVDDSQKDTAGKPAANGAKDDDKDDCSLAPPAVGPRRIHANCSPASEELSEEDQQLKNELEMIVERLTVRCPRGRVSSSDSR